MAPPSLSGCQASSGRVVVVESPAKAVKIQQYLGKDYQVRRLRQNLTLGMAEDGRYWLLWVTCVTYLPNREQ